MDNGEVTANDAAKALKIQLSAAEGMIEFLLSKRLLSACTPGCSKGSCGGCPIRTKKYRWVG